MLSKDESTEENQAYWRFVDETSVEFEKWPQWLKAGSQIVAIAVPSPISTPPAVIEAQKKKLPGTRRVAQ